MIRILIICLISFQIQFSATAPAEHSFILEVRATGDNWCPQQCPGLPNQPGYTIELITESLKEMNVNFRFFFQSWAKATETVSKGYYDILLTTTSSETHSLSQPTKAIFSQSFCHYQLKELFLQSTKLSDLQDRRVAYLQKIYLGKELTAHLNNPENKIVTTEIDNKYQSHPSLLFQFLLNKSTDNIVLPLDLAEFYLQKNGEVKKKVERGYCTPPLPWYIGVSSINPKREQELIRILDRGLKKLKSNGRYQEIMNKYFSNSEIKN